MPTDKFSSSGPATPAFSIAELRRGAEQARAFAKLLVEPITRQEFLNLAERWEREAGELETKNEMEKVPIGD